MRVKSYITRLPVPVQDPTAHRFSGGQTGGGIDEKRDQRISREAGGQGKTCIRRHQVCQGAYHSQGSCGRIESTTGSYNHLNAIVSLEDFTV